MWELSQDNVDLFWGSSYEYPRWAGEVAWRGIKQDTEIRKSKLCSIFMIYYINNFI